LEEREVKLSSTQLQAFLANRVNTGNPANVFTADLYTFCTGSGRTSLNENHTPVGGSVSITPPTDGLGIHGTYLQDLGAREANGDCLKLVTSGPTSGQYVVSGSTYTFGDSNPKLISYLFYVGATYGLPTPTVLRLCSADQNISIWGQIFKSAGQSNNPGATPQAAIQRSKLRVSTGLEVTNLQVDLFADPTNTVNNSPILQQIANGMFDGAVCYVQRLIMPTWGQPIPGGILESGLLILFSGNIAEQKAGRSKATLTVRSRTELLNTQMPRRLFGPGCQHVLFDVGCTLNPASFLQTGQAQAGSNFSTIQTNLNTTTFPGPISPPTVSPGVGSTTIANLNLNPTQYWVVVTYVGKTGETTPSPQTTISLGQNRLLQVTMPTGGAGVTGFNVYAGLSPGDWELQTPTPLTIGSTWTMSGNGIGTGPPPPIITNSGWFDLGVICFTSGVLAGQWRPVNVYLGDGSVNVVPAFPVSPSSGDSFNILPGCARTPVVCQQKFNNLINIGSFPYIPDPSTVI
jgi:hypothetical protein